MLRNIVSRYITLTKAMKKMLKEKLANLQPPISDHLPKGGITVLAEKFGFARQTISGMLRGEVGNEENIKSVLMEALRLIEDNAKNKANYLEGVHEKLEM